MAFSALVADIIPGYAGHTCGQQNQIDLIVVHGTCSPCTPGGARGNAHYFQESSSGGMAHYTVDPAEIIGCCDENTCCWHAPPNTGSVGVELCDWQGLGPDGDVNLWGDQPHTDMMNRAAKLVADIADRKSVTKQWRTTDDLKAGRRNGITAHYCVAEAYRRTDHTDPGPYFPVDVFMGLVTGTTPHNPAPPIMEAEVFIAEFLDHPGDLWLCEVAPQSRSGGKDDDPSNRYGTRTRIVSPDWFWILAGDAGVPVRSGKIRGMGLYHEVV